MYVQRYAILNRQDLLFSYLFQSSSQTRTDVFQKNNHRVAVNCFYKIDPHSDQGGFAERTVPGQDNCKAAPLSGTLSL